MLVSASRRNELPHTSRLTLAPTREVRDGEDAIANTRDARAPQNSVVPCRNLIREPAMQRINNAVMGRVDSLDRSSHGRDRSMNLIHATQHPPSRDLAKTRRLGLCSRRFQSARRPDNGNHRNRFLVADNSGTARASILFRETD